jgi:TonB family protein
VKRTSMAILYGVSFVLHASLGAGMAEIEPEKERERIAISMVEPPKPKSKEEPPKPPPPQGDSLHGSKEPVKRATQAKTLAAPKAEEASAAPVVESKPKLLSAPLPEYPESARAAGVEGKVRLQLSISAEGKVVEVKVLESLGHGCDEAAIAVARTYEFEPATRDGQPVATTITIGIRFAL